MQLAWSLVELALWAVLTGAKFTWRFGAYLFRLSMPRANDSVDNAAQGQVSESVALRERIEQAAPRVVADERFAPADRIYHVAFPRGFSAKVYVYKARGEVRRVLSTTDATISRKLEYALMSTRIPLTTLSLKDHSMEDILRDTEVKGAEAINAALASLRKIRQFELPESPASAPPAKAAANVAIPAPAVEMPAAVAAPPDSGAPTPERNEAPGSVVSSRTARKGVAITGTVLAAQDKEALFSGPGRKDSKGTTFEVTLDTLVGETSMRGVVLREECTRLGVKPGDRVSITPLGRRRVLDGENDTGYMKNMFKVELLERASA